MLLQGYKTKSRRSREKTILSETSEIPKSKYNFDRLVEYRQHNKQRRQDICLTCLGNAKQPSGVRTQEEEHHAGPHPW